MNQTNGNSKPGVGQTTPESSPDNHHYDEGLGGSTTAVEQISGRNGSLMGTAESLGRMEIEDKKMNYVGGDHWVASQYIIYLLSKVHCPHPVASFSALPSSLDSCTNMRLLNENNDHFSQDMDLKSSPIK